MRLAFDHAEELGFVAFRFPSLSASAWFTVDRMTQHALWFIIFAILAPILGPRAYGLFSIVMVFVGLCEFILIEGGVEALVTVKELDHLHTTTANLANGGIALALTLVISALAPEIAVLFHEEELKYLIWVLAPLPVLSSLSATPIAVLQRSMQFRRLAIRSIAAISIGGAVGIALALSGAGVWALALQVIAQRIAEFTIVWISAPVRFGLKWSGAHFREIGAVGRNVGVARVMSVACGQLPRFILGYTLGPTEVGLYSLANRFLDIIIHTAVSPRTRVARMELRSSKPDSPAFERVFSIMTQDVSLVSFPIFLGAAALTPDLFHIWLDQRWQPGVIPMQLILLSGLPLVLFYCIDAALLAASLSTVFAWAATAHALTIIATMLCVAPLGLDLTCLSLAVRPWVLLPILLVMVRRSVRLPTSALLLSPLRSLIGAIIMAALLTLPFLRPSWFYQKFDFVFLVVFGMIFYGVFLYSFARTQLKVLLGGMFVHGP
jgi:O-antigen/teichoic acid export membrane protein